MSDHSSDPGESLESCRLWGRSVEWNDVLELLAASTSTPGGRARALAAVPLTDAEAVSVALDDTTQARRCLVEQSAPGWGSIPDVDPILDRCRAVGSVLDGLELRRLRSLLEVNPLLRVWGARVRALAPALAAISEGVPPLDDLRLALGRAVADDGTVTDDASPQLRTLRRRIRTLKARIVRNLEDLLQSAEAERLFADRYVTVRNGRYVVPLRAEARARLRGIVHDRSQSGQTLFIEPDRVVEMSNELTQETRAEAEEVARILTELTDAVRSELPAIRQLAAAIAELDWILARARLAERMNATARRVVPARSTTRLF